MSKLNIAKLPRSATCQACFAPVTSETYPNGSRVAVDYDPSQDGTLERRNGVVHVVDPTTFSFGAERFHPHSATCLARKGPRAT